MSVAGLDYFVFFLQVSYHHLVLYLMEKDLSYSFHKDKTGSGNY